MLVCAAATIVVNGSIVAGSVPACVTRGRVIAPLAPAVVRLATRVAYDAGSATVTIERGGRRIVVPVALVANQTAYVALGDVVRRLGGSAVYDGATRTLAIALPQLQTIATPVPFDLRAPQADATSVFTPAPPPATPRAIESGVPRPRRTAIPVVPSQPVLPPPRGDAPTNPRR